jgi:hypothetical protein
MIERVDRAPSVMPLRKTRDRRAQVALGFGDSRVKRRPASESRCDRRGERATGAMRGNSPHKGRLKPALGSITLDQEIRCNVSAEMSSLD